MASPETDLIGQTIDTKYRVEALLGRGGMGAVFRAVHLGTDRVVALKVIAPSLAEQPEYLARFSREARACGRLRHPGIVDVTDFGIANHNGRSLAYLVMEFLDGATLADTLKAQPRPPLPWVIDILEQTCSAVEEGIARASFTAISSRKTSGSNQIGAAGIRSRCWTSVSPNSERMKRMNRIQGLKD